MSSRELRRKLTEDSLPWLTPDDQPEQEPVSEVERVATYPSDPHCEVRSQPFFPYGTRT